MIFFIFLDRVDCAVLSDSLLSSIVLMLLSGYISSVTFVDPMSSEGSSILRSVFSVVVSAKSVRWTGYATAVAYETLMRRFSGRDGAESKSSVASFGLTAQNFLTRLLAYAPNLTCCWLLRWSVVVVKIFI
jgi:hypothetical protein